MVKKETKSSIKYILQNYQGSDQNEKLNEYVQQNPDDPNGFWYLGKNYLENQHVELLGVPVVVLGTASSSPESREKSRIKNLERAKECYQKFMELSFNQEDMGLYQRLNCELFLNKFQSVIDRGGEYIKEEKGRKSKLYDGFLSVLGIAHRELGHLDEALEWFRKIPDDSKIIRGKFRNIGICLLCKDDLKGVLRNLDKSLKFKKSEYIPILINAVKAELDERPPQAIEFYGEFIDKVKYRLDYHFIALHAEKRMDGVKSLPTDSTEQVNDEINEDQHESVYCIDSIAMLKNPFARRMAETYGLTAHQILPGHLNFNENSNLSLDMIRSKEFRENIDDYLKSAACVFIICLEVNEHSIPISFPKETYMHFTRNKLDDSKTLIEVTNFPLEFSKENAPNCIRDGAKALSAILTLEEVFRKSEKRFEVVSEISRDFRKHYVNQLKD